VTVRSLVVNLEANAASYMDQMEKAAHHTEMVGRRITRAGIEISKVFAPIAALYAGALTAAVKQSAIVHGELAQAWDRLVLSGRLLLREIGGALTPAFNEMIRSKEALIEKVRQVVAWFEQLSPSTQALIVKVGLFLAVLGPTVLIIGEVIRAAGALSMVFVQLTNVIFTGVGAALEFLLSPVGFIILGILTLAAAVFLLIRHWELAKQVAAATWQEIKVIVLDAMLGILVALEMIPAGTPIFGGLGDAAAAAIPKILALRDAVQHTATQMFGALKMDKPLLPEWLTDLPGKIKGMFTLPKVEPLPSLPTLQAQDALAKLQTQLHENAEAAKIFGSSFNLAGADASAYKATIDELLKQGLTFDQIANLQTGDLGNLGTKYQELSRIATQLTGIINAQNKALGDSFVALGSRLGEIFAGTAHGFHGFGKVMEGILGGMLTTLGQVLIAYGTAGIAIQKFITNPYAAIAAGIALVALGSALSSAAQNTVSGGGGGGAAAAPSTPSSTSQSSQGSGKIILELHGDSVVGALFSDPANLDALAQALQDLSGRNVEVVPVMG
jgi:hypothetical protein